MLSNRIFRQPDAQNTASGEPLLKIPSRILGAALSAVCPSGPCQTTSESFSESSIPRVLTFGHWDLFGNWKLVIGNSFTK